MQYLKSSRFAAHTKSGRLRDRKTAVIVAVLTAVGVIAASILTASAATTDGPGKRSLASTQTASGIEGANNTRCMQFISNKYQMVVGFNVSVTQDARERSPHAVLDIRARRIPGRSWSGYRFSYVPDHALTNDWRSAEPIYEINVRGEDGTIQAIRTDVRNSNTRIKLVPVGSWTSKRFVTYPTAAFEIPGTILAEKGKASQKVTYQFRNVGYFAPRIVIEHAGVSVHDAYLEAVFPGEIYQWPGEKRPVRERSNWRLVEEGGGGFYGNTAECL